MANCFYRTGSKLIHPINCRINRQINTRIKSVSISHLKQSIRIYTSKRTNISEIKANNKLGRLTTASFTTGYVFKAKSKDKKSDKEREEEEEQVVGNPDDYIDFNIPWSLKIDYSWNYNKPGTRDAITTKTMRFSGDISITKKWKISGSSGYDFEKNDLTYTTIDIHRDLHCWEARFTWVPFGAHQSYNFQINVKPGVLQDLKWAKRKSWYDNF